METTPPLNLFDQAYQTDAGPPWVIGAPQPAVVALRGTGLVKGAVLDPGCGTGEHTIYLTEHGYDVVGIDFSPTAVRRAKSNAAARGVAARFEVADALRLDEWAGARRFDTVVDSALFHVFDDADRAAYVRSLWSVCRPGALVHVLALSDVEPGFGPRIGDSVIRDAFATDGWDLESLHPSRYRVMLDAREAAELGLPAGPADLVAWLARVRRI
ncbi:class I SAM-dependent methyltransferase [Pseudonocardia acaciae]|uniref:class I SAM-dependent methyltransferase n=1 Tax=Pseudonocardia acaciae TaxID=551276 RepID=UPI00048A5C79|nr:class I SAM-dependent methyltransferase [Pseudonocardia acaciae]